MWRRIEVLKGVFGDDEVASRDVWRRTRKRKEGEGGEGRAGGGKGSGSIVGIKYMCRC